MKLVAHPLRKAVTGNSRGTVFSSFLAVALASSFIVCLSEPVRAQSAPRAASDAAISVQFAFGGNVAQIPIEVTDNLVFVPVRINGAQPSWFLLDTARSASCIDDVRAAGLGLLSPDSEAGGKAARTLRNVVLEFPSLGISVPLLPVNSFSEQSENVGRVIQGVLGADVLSHFVVVLNYDRLIVQLYDPKSFQYKGGGEKLKTESIGGVPAIEAKVNVHSRGTMRGLFRIATGLSQALEFSPGFASANKLGTINEKTLPFLPSDSPGQPEDELGRVHLLTFGKNAFQDPLAIFPGKPARLPAHSSAAAAGSIGGEILRRFTLILDYPDQSLILEPNRKFSEPFAADMSGLVLIALPPDFHSIEVARVLEDSPAAQAGFAIGDVIEAIDARPASEYSLDDVRDLLQQQAVAHKIMIRRAGKQVEITPKLKPLI